MGDHPRDLHSLEQRFGIDGVLRFSSGEGGLSRIEIDTEGNSAEIYLHGAHITSFVPAGHEPILWMSERSVFAEGAPIRGGVPICFPWFGAHPTDTSMPNHGFFRTIEWTVESVARGETDVTVTFSSASNEETLRVWPYAYNTRLTVVVGARLSLALEVTNTGVEAFEITEALHSYFSVSDIRFVTIQGLDGTEYFDKLLGGQYITQRGEVCFTSETDRPYLDTVATCTIADPGKSRVIVIEKSESATTVVWNPWIAKSRRMEDFGNEEWSGMVCVETANALRNCISIPPGESHTIGTTLSAILLET